MSTPWFPSDFRWWSTSSAVGVRLQVGGGYQQPYVIFRHARSFSYVLYIHNMRRGKAFYLQLSGTDPSAKPRLNKETSCNKKNRAAAAEPRATALLCHRPPLSKKRNFGGLQAPLLSAVSRRVGNLFDFPTKNTKHSISATIKNGGYLFPVR